MNVDRIVRAVDPVIDAPSLDADARELRAKIMAMPRSAGAAVPPRSARRWRLAVPFAAGLAALAVALTWLLPGAFGSHPAAAALDVRQQGGYYVVTVNDLFADPARYQAQLRAHRVNISLRVVPVTPSAEGRPFVWDARFNGLTDAEARLRKDSITTICANSKGCPLGLKIPVTYTGRATVYLGRHARPGESYQDPLELNAPGAPLHCVAYQGKTVAQVRALLRKYGVPDVRFTEGWYARTSVPDSWYVHEGVLSGPGRALLLVAPTLKRPDAPGPVVTGDPWRKGC